MTSEKSEFKLIDRAFKDTILLMPGWAADYRIFDTVDLDFNYLLPVRFTPSGFEDALLESLKKESLGKISILGWSMGGFLAADFASKYPERVESLTLVGMRKRYEKEGIGKIINYITANKSAYLYKFYRECFEAKNEWLASLIKKYIKEIDPEQLIGGLDYLSKAELNLGKSKAFKVRFIHGEDDSIAPVKGALSLKAEFPMTDLVLLKDTGHAPFLRSDFKEVFYGRQRIDKAALVNNFSKYASSYDEYSGVQSETAGMLARILPKGGVKNILEIGCGTGNYTSVLKDAFKDARIKAIDISGPMVEAARQKFGEERVAFEVGDIEAIEPGGIYDLITSNAAFHWLGDLDGVIKKTSASLKNNGALIFSAFGPKTFSEIGASLHSVIGRAVAFTPDTFPGKADIENALSRHFKRVKITERLIRESYPCLYDLLNKIKYSGTRGMSANIGKAWSPGLLKKMEDNYLECFGSIEATYQIFFCEAVKCA